MAALRGDAEAVLPFLDLRRFDQLGQAILIVEIADAPVDQHELGQLFRVDLRGQAAQHKENQQLDIQLVMNESVALLHAGHLPIISILVLYNGFRAAYRFFSRHAPFFCIHCNELVFREAPVS